MTAMRPATAGPAGAATAASPHGRIGPNAILRVAEVLPRFRGEAFTRGLFERAGLLAHWLAPPSAMVDEAEVRALHHALRAALPAAEAEAVSRAAGRATAEYLLAHRIPKPVQALLKRLPAAWAARVLLAAIARHAWTFAGSGRFGAQAGGGLGTRAGARVLARLEIRDNPLCRGLVAEAPACDYYAATFERLFEVLVHPASTVVETACEASGDDACRFELRVPTR